MLTNVAEWQQASDYGFNSVVKAGKVELPPVRGASYEPIIILQSQQETSAFDGAVVC